MSGEELYKNKPFSYLVTKSGLVQISFNDKTITNLKGKAASKFLMKVDSGDVNQAQLIMAKATGHFKHGNEQDSKTKSNFKS